MVPGNPADGFESDAMRDAAETWTGEWWKYGGGGTAWDAFAYDPELDLLYVGVGNGSPWNREIRSPGGGDNLFLASILALDPDNGEYVWHYQTTPGETWDYTATQHMILADLVIDGEDRKVLMQAPKNGFFYVVDRATGELISAEPYVAVNWATHVDLESGRPVEVPGARYEENYRIIYPSAWGGHNWHPMSYSPLTGLVYIPLIGGPDIFAHTEQFEFQQNHLNTGLDMQPRYAHCCRRSHRRDSRVPGRGSAYLRVGSGAAERSLSHRQRQWLECRRVDDSGKPAFPGRRQRRVRGI
jgi:PQQ-dependent dehydrogenase (methanol/ethanol family)